MSSEQQEKWQRRLHELEEEIQQTLPKVTIEPPVNTAKMESRLTTWKDWFNQLPVVAKVGIAAVGIMLAFTLLNFVFKLVASLLSIAILGVILYALYKFLLSPTPPDQP